MKKRFVALALGLCLIAAATAMGTSAYFTAQETDHNVITTGGVAIALEEWASLPEPGEEPVPFEDVAGVMPGAQVGKVVQVANTGASEAWVRVCLAKSITLAQGVEGEPDLSLVTMDINTAAWTEKDGYYYYNKPLAAGETTEPLFTQVSFDKDMGNLYQNCTAQVDVSAQAVQTANNGGSALEAAGWPEA